MFAMLKLNLTFGSNIFGQLPRLLIVMPIRLGLSWLDQVEIKIFSPTLLTQVEIEEKIFLPLPF